MNLLQNADQTSQETMTVTEMCTVIGGDIGDYVRMPLPPECPPQPHTGSIFGGPLGGFAPPPRPLAPEPTPPTPITVSKDGRFDWY